MVFSIYYISQYFNYITITLWHNICTFASHGNDIYSKRFHVQI